MLRSSRILARSARSSSALLLSSVANRQQALVNLVVELVHTARTGQTLQLLRAQNQRSAGFDALGDIILVLFGRHRHNLPFSLLIFGRIVVTRDQRRAFFAFYQNTQVAAFNAALDNSRRSNIIV